MALILVDFFRAKMRERTFLWLLNILVALLIYSNAETGKLLGIKGLPLAFSAVWPATGFSLAAVLLFGRICAPGIFLGNFAYNFLHLFLANTTILGPLLTAIGVSTGSFLQAIFGAYLIRRYSSGKLFHTMRDAVLFLVAGGALTCMIAPTFGVLSLYLYGALPSNIFFFAWLTFWIGDTMGVYIITPLIVVWSLQKWKTNGPLYVWEKILLITLFTLTSAFVFQGYPVSYLFLPLNLWITYRFNFHGYTLAMAFSAFMTILPFSCGHGPLLLGYTTDMLLILVNFLETMVIALIIMAAALKERNEALALLKMSTEGPDYSFKVDTFLK